MNTRPRELNCNRTKPCLKMAIRLRWRLRGRGRRRAGHGLLMSEHARHSMIVPYGLRSAGLSPHATAASTGATYSPTEMVAARIVDTETLRMEIPIGEGEVAYILRGTAAEIYLPICGAQDERGQVVAVAAGSDESGSFLVAIEWDNSCGARVKSGMSATARIKPSGEEAVIVAPSIAVIERDDTHALFVAENGQARLRTVTIGRRFGERVEINDGLNEGDLVIVSALSALRDGTALEIETIGRSGDLQ